MAKLIILLVKNVNKLWNTNTLPSPLWLGLYPTLLNDSDDSALCWHISNQKGHIQFSRQADMLSTFFKTSTNFIRTEYNTSKSRRGGYSLLIGKTHVFSWQANTIFRWSKSSIIPHLAALGEAFEVFYYMSKR